MRANYKMFDNLPVQVLTWLLLVLSTSVTHSISHLYHLSYEKSAM